jgi:hypothetical protein
MKLTIGKEINDSFSFPKKKKTCNWGKCKNEGEVQAHEAFYCNDHQLYGTIMLNKELFPEKYKELKLTETKEGQYSLIELIEKLWIKKN